MKAIDLGVKLGGRGAQPAAVGFAILPGAAEQVRFRLQRSRGGRDLSAGANGQQRLPRCPLAPAPVWPDVDGAVVDPGRHGFHLAGQARPRDDFARDETRLLDPEEDGSPHAQRLEIDALRQDRNVAAPHPLLVACLLHHDFADGEERQHHRDAGGVGADEHRRPHRT